VTDQNGAWPQLLGRPPLPAGVPLTDSMELTDRDGACWLVYIEGIPRPAARFRTEPRGFPGRRLRFDSAVESRVITPVPAGSPFLTEARLQQLLDHAGPVDAVRTPIPPSARPGLWLVGAVRRGVRRTVSALTGSVQRSWQRGTGPPRRLLAEAARLDGQPAVRPEAVRS
jgi:hypothetical protein